ncbi:SusC/RagA family TonB-linked outer membrane protein [Parapedobacter pyrenivorans]|uniref:SusC/RagA family TonB-linked outer membrane protein n=1 Tax=Parapedobacter pyrenivorans TaxID=1305674 RepID=A0A917HEJ8_9SPHI|nr:SusC/RagA family TonB-linked outer membrane protein [Parapedobacter pyrenivorans]GGG76338.1 SusC/RagA family TonB-linked outer membrane protein [Parapedobacter pyrenivorans]
MKRITSLILFCAVCCSIAYSQQKTITGKVMSEDGIPIASVTIQVLGTSATSQTDEEGMFSLVSNVGSTVSVTSVGYQPATFSIDNRDDYEIRLIGESTDLDEVVVTALGIRRERRQLTYSTQQVSGESVANSKEPNVLNALTGKVSGVQITSSSGQPGSSSRIVIRGTSSLLGENEALIVLDGVPINNDEGGNAGPGAGISRISDIDPAIIESINVLKGSAAAALYGSKAARGVVMITTKNGSKDRKPTISFTSQYSLENPILPEVQEKYALGDRGEYYDGDERKTSTVWGPPIAELLASGLVTYNKNPMEEFFRTGKTATNSLSIDGGSARSNYFLSYSFVNQGGVVPESAYDRHAMFAKYTTEISEKLSSTIQLNYTTSSSDRVPEGHGLESPLWTIYTAPRTWNPLPYLDENGNQRVFRFSRNNPYWVLNHINNESIVHRFLPVATFTYKPFTWLTVTERIGADIFAEQTKYYEARSNTLQTLGVIRDRNNNFRQFNHDLIVEARKQFGEDWDISLMLGNNILSTYSQNYQIEGTGLTIEDFKNVSNSERQVSTESHYLQRKVGFYSQANIEFRRFLNLSLTGRYDGSSVLNVGNRYYPYGSMSSSFVFSELLDVPAITFGKLRASYSIVGNDNIGPYSLQTPFQIAGNFPFNNRSGFLMGNTLGNNSLVNEKTKEYEVGLEMQFLKTRLGFEFSYFNRNHVELLTSNIPISPATGYSSTTLNAGDMTNKGIELIVNGSPIKNANFSWDMTVNFSRIRNNVTRIYGDQDRLQIGETWAFLNQPYGAFYNYGYSRNEANEILIDAGGLPMVSNELQMIGNIQPKWLAGITNNFRYRNLSFDFFFDFKKGGDIFNSDERYGFFYGTPKVTENREPRVIPGISVVDNQPNTVEVQAQDYYQRLNLIYESIIQDGTFLKLRNASIRYQFPEKWISRTPFSAVSLAATGRNLWIYAPNFTGSDPEVSSFGSSNGSQGVYAYSVPTARSYNFTLSVNF